MAVDLYILLGTPSVNIGRTSTVSTVVRQDPHEVGVVTHTEAVETVDDDRVCTLLGSVNL